MAKEMKKVSDFQPTNPKDPKIPTLKSSLDNSSTIWEENENNDKTTSVIEEKKEDSSLFISVEKPDNSKALAWLQAAKNENNEVTEDVEITKTDEFGFVIPDPWSPDRLRFDSWKEVEKRKSSKNIDNIKNKMKSMNDFIRDKLTEKQINEIVKTFKHNVLKINRTEVILKNEKYGYEIFFNNADKRWWTSALFFEEPFNPKKLKYNTLWIGNTFIGYGFSTLKETIEKTKEMMARGRTGSIIWKDFLKECNFKSNRIIAAEKPIKMNYKDYAKFSKWFHENKIWIMVKREGSFDAEDLMIQNKEKRKNGEEISPLASIQAKLLDPPRKAQYIVGYPVADPKYKGKEYENPENKLYEVGFTYNE